MTDMPEWVWACLGIPGLDLDNTHVSERGNLPVDLSETYRQGSDNAALSASRAWRKLGPLTQEKGEPFWGSLQNDAWTIRDATPYAGFTCTECPQRERYYEFSERVYRKQGHYERTVRNYTSRCRECSRKMKRWQRGRQDASLLSVASECYAQGISFVTLTTPNMVGRPVDSVRMFKRMVSDFRRRFPRDCISGGKDFYEWTIHPDDRAWSEPIVANVHLHGIWVMDFWDQKEMQKEWGHGIVHLFRMKDSGDAVRYATKYAGKQDVKSIRLKEGFGCLFGRAKRAMLDAYQARQNLGL